MIMRLTTLVVLLLILAPTCLARDSVFHFGAYANQRPTFTGMALSTVDSLKNKLGFNTLVSLGATPSELKLLADSIWIIPDLVSASTELFWTYLMANYARAEAEDWSHEIRFHRTNARTRQGFVYGPKSDRGKEFTFLHGLWFTQDQNFGPFTYGLRVKTDLKGLKLGEALGYMLVRHGGWPTDGGGKIDTFPIMSDHFLKQGKETLLLEWPIPNITEYSEIRVATYQRRKLGIDYFQVSNHQGRQILEDDTIISKLISHAAAHSGKNVLYWYLRDEPKFTNWIPFKILNDSLAARHLPPGNAAFNTWVDQSYNDFIDIARPPFIWVDPYPLYGGQGTRLTKFHLPGKISVDTSRHNTTYFAGSAGPPQYWWITYKEGLQYCLDSLLARELDLAHEAASRTGLDLWYIPQAFGGKEYSRTVQQSEPSDSLRYEIDSGWIWRLPTRSELSCLTFIGMCYPIKGLTYYRYDAYLSAGHETQTGILKLDRSKSNEPSSLWGEIEEKINPYIKAIEKTFVGLRHRQTYSYHQGPSGKANKPYVKLIDAHSNSELPNPDLGWFHIGEFAGGRDKYIMLVNRACSRDSLSSAPAPPITARVRLDSKNLDLGDDVYIIDLATRTDADDWAGIPDTTRAIKSPDGTYDFQAVLGPGEGRLFKIVRKR